MERMLYILCLKQLSGQVWWRGSFNPSTQEAGVGDSEFEASLVFKGVLISQPLSQTKQNKKTNQRLMNEDKNEQCTPSRVPCSNEAT